MNFIPATVLLTLFVSGIRTEAEPLTGSLGGPLPSSNAYKDGHHEYIQAFHHGQHHPVNTGSDAGSSSGVGHSILSPQIQDQSSVVSQDQVSHSTVGGQIGTPIVGGSIVPQVGVPYVPQKSEVPLHFGARAIGSPLPYYPYFGKTYASPYYNQYQPSPYQYPQQSFYPYQQYSASPYSALPYSASPYSSAVTPYSSSYPYNYGYVPQYYPGYPSGSYYQSSGEIQTVTKQ